MTQPGSLCQQLWRWAQSVVHVVVSKWARRPGYEMSSKQRNGNQRRARMSKGSLTVHFNSVPGLPTMIYIGVAEHLRPGNLTTVPWSKLRESAVSAISAGMG